MGSEQEMTIEPTDQSGRISVRNVTKLYGRWKALDDVSFEVEPGESLGMWGPNGAGKTTIMRCLLGIARYQGEVRVGGFDPSRQGREARSLIGFVPQDLPVSPMSVAEMGRFVATLKGYPAGAEKGPLALLGLGDQGSKSVGALSGGMRQRLALALALIGTPRVLLLDEPTANLDARGRAELLALLRDLRTQGLTMVFSSHRPEDVISMADQVLMIEGGMVQSLFPAAEFRREQETSARLVITLTNGHLHEALTALERLGVPASGSGKVLAVDVHEQRKAEIITVLAREGVEIADFEVEHGKWIAQS
jgi:ABC-type multidrug transport system ATPase subunit